MSRACSPSCKGSEAVSPSVELCIVADRGMISADTLTYLEKEKIPYILGARMRKVKEIKEDVLSRAGRYREVYPEGRILQGSFSPEGQGGAR